MYQSVNVRLPNGGVRKAELTSRTNSGYRSARIDTSNGKIRGRVTARHGFNDGRFLPFEVVGSDAWLLDGPVYLR